MRTHVVLTLSGPDRVGVVEEVSHALLGIGANVGESHMARLGGEFAILMMVSLPAEKIDGVVTCLHALTSQGYSASVRETEVVNDARPEWGLYRIEVEGADHEGIIRDITRGLAQHGVNIESMETGTRPAPESGSPLFRLSALVMVPPEENDSGWLDALTKAGEAAGVDVTVTAH